MATIRPQNIAPVDYNGSNRLLQLAQQQLTGGIDQFGSLVTGLRNEAIKRNTAAAVGTLLGAQNPDDLAQRQNQVASMLQQYGGDVDTGAIQQAAAKIPDTLLARTSNQLQINNQQNQLDDQNLAGQAWSKLASGDFAGASQIAAGMHDPSRVINAGLDQQNRQQQLALQQQGLAQSNANAAAGRSLQQQRFDWEKSQDIAKEQRTQEWIKQLSGGAGGSGTGTSKLDAAGTKDALDNAAKLNNQNLSQGDLSTGGKNNLDKWAASNDSWTGATGTRVKDAVSKIPGFGDLPPALQKNALDIGLAAYSSNSGVSNLFSSTNPEQAAVDAANKAISDYSKADQNNSKLQVMGNTLADQQRQQQLRDSLLQQLYRR